MHVNRSSWILVGQALGHFMQYPVEREPSVSEAQGGAGNLEISRQVFPIFNHVYCPMFGGCINNKCTNCLNVRRTIKVGTVELLEPAQTTNL